MNSNKTLLIRRITNLMLVCIIALLAAVSARSVYAGTSVDPSTLNPPPPVIFNPVCYAAGPGVICTVAFTETLGPDGTGLFCGSGANSFEVVTSAGRTVNGRRFYDANKNLTERQYREVFEGTYNNPLTGAYLTYNQSDTVINILTVPGDLDTGTYHISGSTRVFTPAGATVLTDAGTSVLAADGTILSESAHHPFDAYYAYGDPNALQPICDALTK